MNEEELRGIWQKNENLSLANIDFESIKQKAIYSQCKLRNRLKREIIFGVVLYLLLIPIFYVFPKVMFMIPIFIGIWVWYLWELNKIFNFEANLQNFDNLKEVLQTKRRNLLGYFRRTRYISWIGTPVLLLINFVIFTSIEHISQNLMPFAKILILTQIVVIVFMELWLLFVYRPYLVEIEDLLRQLDETQ